MEIQKINTGDLINALLNDSDIVSELFEWGLLSISSFLATAIMIIFMIFYIGYECMLIFLVITVIQLSEVGISKIISKYNGIGFEYGDKRIKFLNEIIKGIRIIKMYANLCNILVT